MRIAFDLDGTAWQYRDVFSKLAHILKYSEHEVGILTAHAEGMKEADIRLWKARGFPEPDFYYGRRDHNVSPAIDKATQMETNGIDILFEDADGGVYMDELLRFVVHGTVIQIK